MVEILYIPDKGEPYDLKARCSYKSPRPYISPTGPLAGNKFIEQQDDKESQYGAYNRENSGGKRGAVEEFERIAVKITGVQDPDPRSEPDIEG
jgi:hypothetical protein